MVKHNGPLPKPYPPTIAAYNARHDLELESWPGPEAQVAAIADDIAYDHHDLDDGLRAGMFSIEDLTAAPHAAAMFREQAEKYPAARRSQVIHESVRRLIGDMVHDVLAETERRLADAEAKSAAEIRGLGHAVVAFSDAMRQKDRALKDFLFANMYRCGPVLRETDQARGIVAELFQRLMAAPDRLPSEWREHLAEVDEAGRARLVADYIAGMTDRYAMQLHERMKSLDD